MLRPMIVFLAVICVTYAAEAIMKADPKPAKYKNVEGCYIKDEDIVVPPGLMLPSKKSCDSYRCDRSLKYVTIVGCGVAMASHPCKVVKQTNYILYPHPTCCPTIECPTN